MIGAFAYLIATSTRNKFASQLRRLRNPRYAIALLLGVAYFWLVFFNRSARDTRQPPPPEIFDTLVTLLPLAILVLAIYVWLFVKDRTALAFTPAEVSLLFTAPVSRRALILYKLARAQAAVLTTSLIWVLLLNHGNRGVEHAVSYWLMLSTISMHRLGVALVRTSHSEHGASGFRRTWPVLLVVLVVVGAVSWGLINAREALMGAFDLDDFRRTLVTIISTSPVSWALYPFHVLIAPTFARTTETWVPTLVPAAILILVHVLWVVMSDAAFEEAAAEASAHQAQRLATRRARGVSTTEISSKARKRSFPLAPTGAPAVAILWKNYLWLARTGQFRALLGLPLVCAIVAVGFAGRSSLAEIMVFTVCVAIASMTVIFGPMTMRNDLRGELARISIIKTLPLKGRDIMLAEVASTALPTALMQFLLTAVAMFAMTWFPKEGLSLTTRIGVVLGAPMVLVGLNIANFTIHNGMALLFPAWVRIGDTGANGLEAMGQSMLTAIVTLLILALLLIAPAIAGATVYFTLRGFPVLSMAAAGGAAGVVLGLESYGLMNMLGGQLDRLEPSQVS